MNQEVSITKEQVQKEMKYFRRLFPIVRLLDGERLLRRNDGMEAEPVEIDAPEICHCYDLWKYSAPCKHCIALEAVRSRKEKCKLEIVGNDIYQVIARYLEMNGKPYVMELVHRLDEDALTDLEEKQYLIEQLTGYNEKLYQDVLTGVFNRRYYEEKIKNMWGPVGIAMMDLDNFKYYNDSYGHNVGDLALNSAAKVILSNIRKSDFLIRYGGDEFLLVLPGIRKDAFDKKLNQIQKQLHQTTLDGYPGISLSVSIGGVTTVEETVGTALERADRLMYQAKKHRNQVVTESSTEGIRQKVGERLERDSGRELVLIVDDAKINREILFEMLKDRFDIIEASSGEECLEILAGSQTFSAPGEMGSQQGQLSSASQPHSPDIGQESGGDRTAQAPLQPAISKSSSLPGQNLPDLLLLDISMDGWDGWETARQVRNRLDAAQLPVVFVSANMIDNQSDMIRQALCQGFVAKPVLETELLDTLENVLKLRWIRAEPAATAAAVTAEPELPLVPLPPELHEDLMRMARQGRAPALRERLREALGTLPAEANTLTALLACLDRFDFDGLMSTLTLSQRQAND